MPKRSNPPWGKPLVFILALLPLAWLGGSIVSGNIGPDPVETVVLTTGGWALRFLLLTLAVSPLREYLQLPWLLRYRRMLGLYCFFYASLHLLFVATYILGWDMEILREELSERPYMVMGFSAWLMLLPLALTSTQGMMRRLGRRWKQLHRLIYPASLVAIGHFIWLVRSDFGEVLLYTLLLLVLLGWRLKPRLQRLLPG